MRYAANTQLNLEKSKLVKWLVNGLPDEIVSDPKSRSEALLLSFMLFSSFVSCLIFLLIVVLFFDQSPLVFDYGAAMILACVLNYIAAWFVLVRLKSIVMASNLSLVVPYLCIILAGWTTGGVFSPMLYLLVIPPVFAFLLTGLRSGLLWFFLVIITFSGFGIIDYTGVYEPLFLITSSDYPLIQFLMPVTTCVSLMMVLAIYEVNSMRLKRLLSQEKTLLAFKATHDPLTQLANREEFNTQIDMAIASARHSDYPLSLVYMDLDGFKPINDTLGHHAGDQVLIAIAARLRRLVRGTDTVARLGGDEFAVILQGVGNKQLVEPILQKFLDNIADEIILDDGMAVTVYASLGVAFLELESKGEIDGETLCRQADSAMYQAKTEKNTWRVYEKQEKIAEL